MTTHTPMRCGFCLDGFHDKCPGGVRNGNGKILVCSCGCELSQIPRCTVCNHRDPDDINSNWECIDTAACQARVYKIQAANPVLQRIRESKTAAAQRAAEIALATTPLPASTPGGGLPAPSANSKACGCCGQPTKGGKFLPGHDSKFLTRLAHQYSQARQMIIDADVEEIRAQAYAISAAFGAKFDKRVRA